MMPASLRSDARSWKVAVATLAHALVLLAFVHTPRLWVAPMRLPGDAHGSRLVLSYLPGRAAVSSAMPVKVAVVKPAPVLKTALDKVPLPVKKTEAAQAATTAPVAAHPDGATGDDALGQGNVNIALVRSFPAPKPDLSRLPRGLAGDVVVDIVIDDQGKVASLTTLKGLGYGIDEVVVATVRGWTFQPATKDGKPVASEQELHFHYEARG